jgi:tetratricopeptide (TPR) repeat protein
MKYILLHKEYPSFLFLSFCFISVFSYCQEKRGGIAYSDIKKDSLYRKFWTKIAKEITYKSAESVYDFKDQIFSMDSILQTDPINKDAIRLKVQLLSREGKYDSALATLNRSINLIPDFFEFYLTRGGLYEGFGQKDLAKMDFLKSKAIVQSVLDTISNNDRKLWFLQYSAEVNILLGENKEEVLTQFDNETKKGNNDAHVKGHKDALIHFTIDDFLSFCKRGGIGKR